MMNKGWNTTFNPPYTSPYLHGLAVLSESCPGILSGRFQTVINSADVCAGGLGRLRFAAAPSRQQRRQLRHPVVGLQSGRQSRLGGQGQDMSAEREGGREIWSVQAHQLIVEDMGSDLTRRDVTTDVERLLFPSIKISPNFAKTYR